MIRIIKLSEWATLNKVSKMTAFRMATSGKIDRASQSAAGRWFVEIDEPDPDIEIVAYARVFSHDQKSDLDRQIARIAEWSAKSNVKIDRYTKEIGSGLNERRKVLLSLLGDQKVKTIIVEHRDRLARFGVGQLEKALEAQGRNIVIIDKNELNDDLARDMIDLMTCFSARLYGKRSAANRAKRAIEVLQT